MYADAEKRHNYQECSFTWLSVAPACDWILFWQRQHMSALKVLGLKVGQPAAPVNTIWLAILAPCTDCCCH